MRYLFAYIVTLLAVISLTLCENLVLGNHEWSLASIESGDVGRHGDEHGVIFFNFTTPNKKHYLAFHILWNPSVRPPSLKWVCVFCGLLMRNVFVFDFIFYFYFARATVQQSSSLTDTDADKIVREQLAGRAVCASYQFQRL